MRRFVHRSSVALLALLGSCVALADPPQSSSAPEATAASAPAAPAPASAQSPAASTAASPAATAAANSAAEDTEAKRLLADGYKPEMRNGTKVWCRREGELGSRLGHQKHCGTAEELKMTVHDNQEMVEHVQKTSISPSGR
jgi:hypothetical protein